MSVRSAPARLSAGMSATTEQATRPLVDLGARRRRDAQRRRINVAVLRVLVAVVFLSSWEILARLGWIDPFFTSQPTAVADKLWYWITQGTELGPLWEQALVTMGEVVGELFGATQGLGELIYNAKNLFDIAGVFAGMGLLAAMALVAEALITALEDRLIKWRPPVATETRI